jgi:hypothetical protein
LTGFSTAVVGIQWEHNDGDREIVRRVLNVLEDRRILFEQYCAESPDQCVLSAIDIRRVLTTEMNTRGISDGLQSALKDLRAIFTAFLNSMRSKEGQWLNQFGLTAALATLRSLVGERLSTLCVDYDIEIVGRLKHIVPNSSDWFFLNFNHGQDPMPRIRLPRAAPVNNPPHADS